MLILYEVSASIQDGLTSIGLPFVNCVETYQRV